MKEHPRFRRAAETAIGFAALTKLALTPHSATREVFDANKEQLRSTSAAIITSPSRPIPESQVFLPPYEGTGRTPEIGPETEYKTIKGSLEKVDKRPHVTYLIIKEDTDIIDLNRDDGARLIRLSFYDENVNGNSPNTKENVSQWAQRLIPGQQFEFDLLVGEVTSGFEQDFIKGANNREGLSTRSAKDLLASITEGNRETVYLRENPEFNRDVYLTGGVNKFFVSNA